VKCIAGIAGLPLGDTPPSSLTLRHNHSTRRSCGHHFRSGTLHRSPRGHDYACPDSEHLLLLICFPDGQTVRLRCLFDSPQSSSLSPTLVAIAMCVPPCVRSSPKCNTIAKDGGSLTRMWMDCRNRSRPVGWGPVTAVLHAASKSQTCQFNNVVYFCGISYMQRGRNDGTGPRVEAKR
jgi:hypothetical protein